MDNEGIQPLNYQEGDKLQEPQSNVTLPPIVKVKNIVIQNGRLGRTSHDGIHGNGATNVRILNLKVQDFEVINF